MTNCPQCHRWGGMLSTLTWMTDIVICSSLMATDDPYWLEWTTAVPFPVVSSVDLIVINWVSS